MTETTPDPTSLLDLVGHLDSFDGDMAIYVSRPWSPESNALVVPGSDDASPPNRAAAIGATYFIEVGLARDFLAAWRASCDDEQPLRNQVERLIAYAENDA